MPKALYETYRPTSLDHVIGQDKAVAMVRRIIARGVGGARVWLSGPSGTGKTTLAKIMAAAHCPASAVTELDSADEVNTEQLDAIDDALRFRPIWGALEKRAWIINEAHGLKASAIRRLLGIIERIAEDDEGRILIVFTTTKAGEEDLFGAQTDAGPLLGRCTKIALTNQGLAEPFAARALEIARGEGLDGQPLAEYVKLARRCKNSMRAMLEEIDSGCMIAGGAA